MAKKDDPDLQELELALDVERVKKRLNMFDQRLDNIDSIITAVAERVMNQPITFNITCSKCGHNMEVALFGMEKPNK